VGILFDSQLSFKLHTDKLISKLRLKFGFYFRNITFFSFQLGVWTLFTTIGLYADVLLMNAPVRYLFLNSALFYCSF